MEYSEINISNLDFAKYDLNNSSFLGVNFVLCDFTGVYLSGSNFGGSVLKKCVLKDNIVRKASWDDVIFKEIKITSIDAFRTTFMFNKFIDMSFESSDINKCSFSDSELTRCNKRGVLEMKKYIINKLIIDGYERIIDIQGVECDVSCTVHF